VRIRTDGQFGGYFQAVRIDDKKRVVLFGKDQQSVVWSGLCIDAACSQQ
jgi:hypothetical protein